VLLFVIVCMTFLASSLWGQTLTACTIFSGTWSTISWRGLSYKCNQAIRLMKEHTTSSI